MNGVAHRRERSEQDVLHESSESVWQRLLAPDNDDQFTAELRFRCDSLYRPAIRVQGKHAMWNDAHAQAKRHQVHDEIEAVGVHRHLKLYTVSFQPGIQP